MSYLHKRTILIEHLQKPAIKQQVGLKIALRQKPAFSWLAELPTILDIFYWCSQYHKQSYRVGGWWVPTKWEAKAMSTLKTTKWHPLVPFSPLWPNLSASHVVNYSWLSACQEEMEPFKDNSSTYGHLTSLKTSHSKSNLGNFQHQYLLELLANVYSYHFMVKMCICVLCVEADFSQIQSLLQCNDTVLNCIKHQHT